MKRLRPALAMLLLGLGSGCEKKYEALTAPPPGLIASLDDGAKTIHLSKGVSIAFECTDDNGDPCGGGASSGDRGTALVFPANLDSLTELDHLHGPQPRSAVVVVGIAEGHTDVQAGGGSLSVTVVK